MNKIFRSLLLLCATVLLGLPASAQKLEVQFSDQAYAGLLTCGPGNDFYTTFGHTALRICDTNARRVWHTTRNGVDCHDTIVGLDIVYNYGTFSFCDNFYFKFARGRLDYCLSRVTYNSFLFEYTSEGRYVYEQRFNLSHDELVSLFDALEENYLPENRYYQYDFFKDNCATRVRDKINDCIFKSTGETLFVESTSDTNLTFRQLLHPHMDGRLEWWKLGIDLVLGSICDQHASNLDYDFCPFELSTQCDSLRRLDPDDSLRQSRIPLTQPRVQLLAETRTPPPYSLYPTLIFWAIFLVVLALTVIAWVKQARGSRSWKLRGLDAPLFLVVALISLVVIFLWFFSDHYCTKGNLNILWASPLFFYLGLFTARSNRWVVLLQMLMLVVLIGGFWWLPQEFHPSVIPIALILLVRLLSILRGQRTNPSETK